MDVRAEFTRFCGPSVLYKMHKKEGSTLRIIYAIPALGEDEYRVTGYLRNGLQSVLRAAVLRMAATARDDAYCRTGHRAADMQRLLSGRTV